MATVYSMLALYFLFLHLTVVVSQISWENCGSKTSDIKLLNLTITPDPIVAPGSVSVAITIDTNQNLTNPLKAILSLRKKILIGSIPVPCFGSCTYDNLCTLCTQCNCPLQAGIHTLTLPITIDKSSWMLAGNYQAQINLETSPDQKGCVKIMNINIRTNK